MATTPVTTRNAHWQNEVSELSFASPLRDVSAQSIQYVNAQLVAHGFTHGAGIHLGALPSKDQQVALKCLVNMLGQRVVDMARTEELTTRYKTLAYDHERLAAQHTIALTTAATAERDVETAKARMDTMLKRLVAEEEAQRKSREEFQKLKSSMQYLRQTTANELKRKEKEVEKMMERLGKMSNDQIKLGTVGAGLACTNLLPDNPLPQDKHYLDAALNQSEAARLALLKENDALRDTILACANALQSVHHTTLASMTGDEDEEPELILSQTLFSATNGEQTQAVAAQAKLRNLFSQLRDAVEQIVEDRDVQRRAKLAQQQELEELRDLAADYEARLPIRGNDSSAQSTNLAPTAEEDLARVMEEQRQELQALAEERSKIAEATTKLEQDRVALEVERTRFLEERTVLDKHMVDKPLKVDDDRAPVFNRPTTPEPTVHAHRRVSSPKSPEEPRPGVRRPSSPIPSAVPRRKSPPATKPIFSHPTAKTPAEPEVVHPTTPPPLPLPRRSLSEHIHASLKEPSPPASRPPSPLPTFLWEREQLLQEDHISPDLTEDDLVMPYERDGLYPPIPKTAILQGTYGPLRLSEKVGAQAAIAIPPHLKTPVRPLFSVPKKHKYSPAVPSPLSRIAMMGESPSPPSSPEPAAMKKLQPVEEERTADLHEQLLHAQCEADSGDEEDIFSDDDEEPCEDDTQGSSSSALTHILNMGASPALAPLVSGFQFPGLLGPAPPLNLVVELPKPDAAPKRAAKPTGDTRSRVAVLEKADNVNRAQRTDRPQHAAKGSKKSSSSSNGSESGSSGSENNAKGRPTSTFSGWPKPSTTGRTTATSRPAPTAKGRVSDKSEKENAGNKLVPLRKPSGLPPKSVAGTVKPTSRPPSAAAVSRKVASAPGVGSRLTAPNRIVKRS